MAENREPTVPSTTWPRSSVFDDFRKEMDGLINGFFGGRGVPSVEATWSKLPAGVVNPAIDVVENDDAITLTAELPGMEENDVDLTVREGSIILKGQKKHEHDEENDNMHVSERAYGSFQRVMPVPDRVDAAKIKAKFDKGVLTVTLPKKPESVASARKISIEK